LSESRRAAWAWLERAQGFGRMLENTLLVAGIAALILIATGQILLRNVFSIGLVWADGALRLIVLWLALLGAVAASRDNKHIAIDVIDRFLTQRMRRITAVARHVVTCAVSAALAWYSWVFVRDSREFGDTMLGDWPAWWFQIIMPVAFALIAYRYLLRAIAALRLAP
jgi:TRAP-type C4-dicarboxylate transport system permease small subunit